MHVVVQSTLFQQVITLYFTKKNKQQHIVDFIIREEIDDG